MKKLWQMHSWAAMLLHLQTTDLNTCTTINAWHGELVMKKYGLCCLPLITSPKHDVPQAWGALQQKTTTTNFVSLIHHQTLRLHDCQSDLLAFAVPWLSVWFVGLCSCMTVSVMQIKALVPVALVHYYFHILVPALNIIHSFSFNVPYFHFCPSRDSKTELKFTCNYNTQTRSITLP